MKKKDVKLKKKPVIDLDKALEEVARKLRPAANGICTAGPGASCIGTTSNFCDTSKCTTDPSDDCAPVGQY